MSRQVTLKQVASHAGVSFQTVSKVLNHQAQVSRETEERIWASIRVLGYRPNQVARSLRAQRTYLIGYSWAPAPPDTANPVLDQFLQSMAQAADVVGFHILAFPYRPGFEWVELYRDLIDTSRVDGFVLSSVEYNDPRIQFLQERHFPFVAFGRSNPEWDFPYVDIDGAAGLRAVVTHLLSLGHRRFGVLAWPQDSRVGNNRLDGLLGGLQDAGITAHEVEIARGDGVYAFGLEAAGRWLDRPERQRPTAIIALNDLMAIGAIHAAQQRGLCVGQNLAVTGFDDHPLVQYLHPALTTVRQPIWEVGQRVISMLRDVLAEEELENRSLLLPPRLLVRESSSGCQASP